MENKYFKKAYNHSSDQNVQINQSLLNDNAPLKYIDFKQLEITSSCYSESLDNMECCIVVLEGKVTIKTDSDVFDDIGARRSIFDKIPTDSVYIPIKSTFTIISLNKAKLALCYAKADQVLEPKLIPARDVKIENRGKNNNQRYVQTVLNDQSPISQNLIVVEVFTYPGHTSSYPPHRHDHLDMPNETLLEETYYHEVYPSQGFVMQRVYNDDLSINEAFVVNNKDVVICPEGYHPVLVPDGYDSYYLNVMGGPVKKWLFHYDEDHAWLLKK